MKQQRPSTNSKFLRLSPSLPHRLQVGLKHLILYSIVSKKTHWLLLLCQACFFLIPVECTYSLVALRLWWCLLSCGHSDIISSSSSIVGVFEPSHTQTVRGTVFSHGSRMWSSDVDVYFLPVCRLRFMMSGTLAKIFCSHVFTWNVDIFLWFTRKYCFSLSHLIQCIAWRFFIINGKIE